MGFFSLKNNGLNVKILTFLYLLSEFAISISGKPALAICDLQFWVFIT